MALVLLAIVATGFRAVRKIGVERSTAAAIIIGAGIVGGSASAVVLTGFVVATMLVALIWEHVHPWEVDEASTPADLVG